MDDEEKDEIIEIKKNISQTSLGEANTTPTHIDSTWANDIKKQKIIFPLLVNSLIIFGIFINTFYFRFVYYNNKEEIRAQLYINLFFFAMIILSYFKAALTSPRQTDMEEYFNCKLPMHTSSSPCVRKGIPIINLDQNSFTNKCEHCDKVKFERSSHCRVCKACVVRRDHHCVWIANCVGLNNNQFFVNFCVWVVVSIYSYLYNCFFFFIDYRQIVSNYPDRELGYIFGPAILIFSFLLFSIFLSVFAIIIQQLFFTFNNYTYLENTKKAYDFENHYCFYLKDNELATYNYYNKGFLTHFFYVIGPTLFHLFFPISKCIAVNYPIQENCPLFTKNKQYHPFQIHRHMKSINIPGTKEAWNEQLKAMDPNNFMEIAYNNYRDKKIL